jgi:hypothetical protein
MLHKKKALKRQMIDDAGKVILESNSRSITVNSYSHKNRCRLLSGTRILKVKSHGKKTVTRSISMEISDMCKY